MGVAPTPLVNLGFLFASPFPFIAIVRPVVSLSFRAKEPERGLPALASVVVDCYGARLVGCPFNRRIWLSPLHRRFLPESRGKAR